MSLHVATLRLSHFRSHDRSQLSCDGRPVAIHGANGAGKTNLLEAVSLLAPGRGLRRAVAADMMRNRDPAGWKVWLGVAAPDGNHEVETWAQEGGRRTFIDGKPAPQAALGQVARVLWLTPAMDRIWTGPASERRRFLDRVTLSLKPAHAEVAMAYERSLKERNRMLKDRVSDQVWFASVETQMAEAGAQIDANRRAALEALEHVDVATAFPRAGFALAGEGPWTAEGLARTIHDQRPRELHAGRSLSGPHRDDLEAMYAAKNIEARHCSTGEQKALLISLVLSNARAVATAFGAPPVLLLDEVAAHLDAARRAALFDEVCTLGAQAWLTGTGPELFTELGNRAAWLEVRGSEEGSLLSPHDPPA